MTAEELIILRNVLGLRRRALIDRLATGESGTIEAAFIALLAGTHTAITAVDAQMNSVLETELDSEPDAELKEV